MSFDGGMIGFLAQAAAPAAPEAAKGGLERFLIFFIQPEVTWCLATAIFLFAVGMWAWLRFRLVQEASLALARAKGTIKRFSNPEDFTDHAEAVYEELRKNPLIGPEWQVFWDHLVPPGADKPIRRTRESEYYFNENLLNHAGINLRFYAAFPGYLLGIGLLCTFFGLVAALYVTSLAMDSDPAGLTKILQTLLATASFKFINSIAGLGSSMLFSWQIREIFHDFSLQTGSFCRTLNELIPCVTPEMLLAERADETAKQTEVIRRLPEEIAKGIETKLAFSLIRLVDPLAEKVEGVANRITEISREAVEKMVKEFRSQLVAAATEEIAILIRGLEATRQSVEGMGAQLADSAKRFDQEMTDASKHVYERMAEGASRVEQSFKNTAQQLEGSLSPLTGKIVALTESFTTMESKMKTNLELFGGTVDGLRTLLADFRSTTEQLANASTPLTTASQDLFTMSKRIQESNEATVSALKQLSSFSQSLSDTTSQTRAIWDAYKERFEKVDDDLKGMVDQLGDGFTRYHGMVDGFIRQLDQSLAKSTQALGASIVELNATLEKIEAARHR
ncbi:MAG TPA: hypothetical protein VIM58_07555 [Candidatus Methylacidiphilales bacterium]